MAVGRLRRRVDAGQVRAFAIVYFESPPELIRETKADAWYFQNAYVLGAGSAEIGDLVGQIPIELTTDSEGNVQAVKEGIGA